MSKALPARREVLWRWPETGHDLGALELFGNGRRGAAPFTKIPGEGVAQNAAAGGADRFAAALRFGDFLVDCDGEDIELGEFCAGPGLGFLTSIAVGGEFREGGGFGLAKGVHLVEAGRA